jgi:response regulator RpfG family c-di-GMP phosphodiesterase
MIETGDRPLVLLVDDEPAVLEGLELQLGRRYEVHLARSGAAGLAMIKDETPYAVVLSDMRMPGMDGAQFLAQVRARAPDTVRLLLTGHADTPSAIAAINDGAVFRFLTKPCAPPVLHAAFEAALAQYRLVTSERELLEKTLRGAVLALAEVLGIVDPKGHGEALRVQRLAQEIAAEIGLTPVWPLEIAALLSSIGRVSLPPETLHRCQSGEALRPEDEAMVAQVPKVTDRLLAPIPRMEPVRAILLLRHGLPLPEDWRDRFDNAAVDQVRRAGQVLRVAAEFDGLTARGMRAEEALSLLRGRPANADSAIIDALVALRARDAGKVEVRQLPLALLRPGMIVAADIYTTSGRLVIGRGFQISEGFVSRLANFPRGRIREPVAVILPQVTKHVAA